MPIFASRFERTLGDSVAQLVEQYTFNVWALGSSPSRITRGQLVKAALFALMHTIIHYSGRNTDDTGRAQMTNCTPALVGFDYCILICF